MIINYNHYMCNNCKKGYKFDTSKEYSNICPECNLTLKFLANYDVDTENIIKPPEMQPEQYFRYINRKPTITCPYCKSTNTKKISVMSKSGSIVLFGVFALGKASKQWHCNHCKSDF